MNYLVCNHCNNKNAVYTPHFVFCNQCNKKIVNNYTDWKKANINTVFEDYLLLETTTNEQPIFNTTPIKQKADKELKLFAGIVFFQLMVFAVFMKMQNNSFIDESNTLNKDYTTYAYWETHSITNDIEIDVPFDLIEATSTLTPFMIDHVVKSTTKKAEALGSFSVTIENFEMNHHYPIPHEMLFHIKDEYMQLAQFEYPEFDLLEHIKTKNYETTMRHGEYTLNSNSFLYDNYTFIKGNNIVNITVSYLKNDKTLNDYADKISERLLNNKTT